MLRREPAIFVCTPEIVRTWLLYPLWLHTPHAYPQTILIDERDYQRVRTRVTREIGKATPYDVATWFRLADFRENIDHTFDYQQHVRASEITKTAHDVFQTAHRLGWMPTDLQQYMAESFQHWLVFGLEQKARLLKGQPIYEQAIDETRAKYIAIKESGNLPFDPRLLLERHFAKLLGGLGVRRAVQRKYPHARVLVFDTGEFSFAAGLLAKYLGKDCKGLFAISEQIDTRLEDRIREQLSKHLHVELPDRVCDPRVADFSSAVAELRRSLSRGKKMADLANDTEEQFRALRVKLDRCLEEIGPTSWKIAVAQPLLRDIAVAMGLEPTIASQTTLGCVAVALQWNAFRATECRELVARMTNLLRLRVRLHVEGVVSVGAAVWRSLLLYLSHVKWPQAKGSGEEEARRQMMAPWVTNSVWYHDMDTKSW